MPAKILKMNRRHRNVAQEILQLETRIGNIEYLLTMQGVTEEQKRRLRPILLQSQAELMAIYDILEAHSA
jgi:hypothetical protein